MHFFKEFWGFGAKKHVVCNGPKFFFLYELLRVMYKKYNLFADVFGVPHRVFLSIAKSQPDEMHLELTLCHLIKHTPNYNIYQLHLQSNCVSQVKMYHNIFCLRNNDNKVKF